MTENDFRAATAEISLASDSRNAAWRRADCVAANRPLLDEVRLATFNDIRQTVDAGKAAVNQDAAGGIAGQYIAAYTPHSISPSAMSW